jgi:hypothetical protein
MQSYALPVCHGMRQDETALQKKACSVTHPLLMMGHDETPATGESKHSNITHILLVMGRDMVRLPSSE